VNKLDEIYQEFLDDIEKVKNMKADISELKTKLNEKQKEMMQENERKISRKPEREAYTY